MLSNFKHLFKLTSQVVTKCEVRNIFQNNKFLNALRCGSCLVNQRQDLHTSTPHTRRIINEYRKAQKDASKKIFFNKESEEGIGSKRDEDFFPKGDLSNIPFDGVLFKDLPVVNIKVSRNNTILGLYDKGLTKIIRSCGLDGFKNSKKGTNVAAQTTGTSFGLRAVKQGYKTVRVVIKGLGPGRVSVLKGIELTGVNIVSITDCTKTYTKQRPRKQKRL